MAKCNWGNCGKNGDHRIHTGVLFTDGEPGEPFCTFHAVATLNYELGGYDVEAAAKCAGHSVRLLSADEQRRQNNAEMSVIKTAKLVSADVTISVPDEVHVYEDGHAVACHADSGDVEYPTLAALETAYRIDTSAA